MSVVTRRPGAAERDPVGHARRRRLIETGLGVGVPIVLIVLWQVASSQKWIDPRFYPSPSTIVSYGRKMFKERGLWTDVWASVSRVLWGYAWGALIGLALGYLMGMSRTLRAALEPLLNVLYTVPKVALIGVFLVIMGFGEKPVIFVIAVTVFFFVWIQTLAAVLAVSNNYREAARSFGSNGRQMFRHVLLPASLPQVFVGLRVAAGVSVLTMVGVEFAYTPNKDNRPAGVGNVILTGRQQFDVKPAFVGIVLASIIGALFVWLVRRIGRTLLPWAPEDEAGGRA
jgi:sulfonate transport system permease protein